MTFRRVCARFLPPLSLLLLLLCVPGLAAELWSHTDNTWKHANGLSLDFPPGFTVASQPSGLLQASGKAGFVGYLVQGTRGPKELAGWWEGETKSYEAEHLKVSAPFTNKLKNGVTGRYMEAERESDQGITFVVVSAALQKGPNAICLHMFYPKEREKNWTPLFTAVFNSVR